MQESVLRFFQSASSPFWDSFFTVFTMFGEQYFIIFIVAWIFWNYSKRDGFFISYIFAFSTLFNSIAKDIAHTERPFNALKNFTAKRVETALGYSFPSGHTQAATTLFVSLGKIFKQKFVMVLAIILSLLVATSRVYLGDHWPIDVIGGFLFAIIITLTLFPVLGRLYQDKNKFFRFILYTLGCYYLIFILILILNHFILEIPLELKPYVTVVGISTGTFLGFIIEEKKFAFEVKAVWWKKILRFIVGIVGTLGIYLGLKVLLPEIEIFNFIRYFLVGAWISCIFPLIGIWIGLFDKEKQ